MGFLGNWIAGFQRNREAPLIKFGRYNDGSKTDQQQTAWESAMMAYEAEEFLQSVDLFFSYLYDAGEDNISWEKTPNRITFILHHGSQAIEGWANANEFHAVVQLGSYQSEEHGLYEEILEHNYNLTYSKYCWEDGIIICKFSSHHIDANPIKLYSGLRELAMETDKQDDLALANYPDFKPLFSGRVGPLEERLLQVKIDFFQKQLKELRESYQHCGLDPNEYPGAYAYLLLNFCYKIDYLLTPEAQLMETLERIHEDYYQGNRIIDSKKNNGILEQINAFAQNDQEQWREEFYQVTNTFGHTTDVSPERLRSFLREEVEKMDWYVREGHREVALAIPGFILGYCLFHYTLVGPFSSFFQLYYEVLESAYFYQLGFRPALSKAGKPQKAVIIKRLKALLQENAEVYPQLAFPIKEIRFDSAFHFSKSYLIALCQMKW